MSENTDPDSAPKKSRRYAPESLADMPPMPPEMIDALGGRPVSVPVSPMAARRVTTDGTDVAAPAVATPARAANPLFDAPSPAEVKAAKALTEVRAAFGKVAQDMDRAARLLRSALGADGVTAAAAREGFDLAAATAVAREFEDFLDRHKPAAPGV